MNSKVGNKKGTAKKSARKTPRKYVRRAAPITRYVERFEAVESRLFAAEEAISKIRQTMRLADEVPAALDQRWLTGVVRMNEQDEKIRLLAEQIEAVKKVNERQDAQFAAQGIVLDGDNESIAALYDEQEHIYDELAAIRKFANIPEPTDKLAQNTAFSEADESRSFAVSQMKQSLTSAVATADAAHVQFKNSLDPLYQRYAERANKLADDLSAILYSYFTAPE